MQLEFNQIMTAARILVAGNGDSLAPKYVKTFSVNTSIDGVKWDAQLDGFSKTYVI